MPVTLTAQSVQDAQAQINLDYSGYRLYVSGEGYFAYGPEEEYPGALGEAKSAAFAQVNEAYITAADAWVPDGDPGTYSYHSTEIIALQKVRTGTGNVTVTRKTIDGGTTTPVSVNDAAFKVITVSVKSFLADLIVEFNGYLEDIAAAETVEAVESVLENL